MNLNLDTGFREKDTSRGRADENEYPHANYWLEL